MKKIEIVQNTNKAIAVMLNASVWMEKSGKHLSKWWQSKNMNRNFLLQHTDPGEFFVALVNGKPSASAILQDNERNQSWKSVDKDSPQKALYVHWLCVARDFAGQGYSKVMLDFAAEEARKRDFELLRLDTDANEKKLCELYESLGFKLMGTEQDVDHVTAFYQKDVA